MIRQIAEKSRFRRLFVKRHGKRSETLLKSVRENIYHIFSSLLRELSRKKSVLVICKILGLFVDILTADDKYSPLNRDNLMQPIQMQLSKISKPFLTLLLHFRSLD